jgi:crotonobetainyl-CoA:carnitine CoA-transferase CaiB-like acyl-CoA transferase
MCLTEKFWSSLLNVIGREDLLHDVRFISASSRSENRESLTELLDQEFRKKSTSFWIGRLGGLLPIAPVNNLNEALDSPFVKDRMVSEVPHPSRPNFRMLSNPIKINGNRLSQLTCSTMGADNKSILGFQKK